MKKVNEEWSKLVEYINNVPIGSTIVRHEIVSITELDRNTVIDNYRLWLEHCGYLSKKQPGVYIVNKHIETNLTSGLVKKMAYNQEYRMNFDRFEKLNEILK